MSFAAPLRERPTQPPLEPGPLQPQPNAADHEHAISAVIAQRMETRLSCSLQSVDGRDHVEEDVCDLLTGMSDERKADLADALARGDRARWADIWFTELRAYYGRRFPQRIADQAEIERTIRVVHQRFSK